MQALNLQHNPNRRCALCLRILLPLLMATTAVAQNA